MQSLAKTRAFIFLVFFGTSNLFADIETPPPQAHLEIHLLALQGLVHRKEMRATLLQSVDEGVAQQHNGDLLLRTQAHKLQVGGTQTKFAQTRERKLQAENLAKGI